MKHAEQNLRVLVVDDERTSRLLIRRMLESEGYQVLECDSGLDVLRAIEEETPDAVLLDILMPGVDGLTLCRELRQRFAATDLPILFITARTADEDLAVGLEAGANDYIPKPINSAILRARLRTQIELCRATGALRSSYEQLAQDKSMKTIGMFASGIAHNFNNLLGTILGSAELVELCSEEGSEVSNEARKIVDSAVRGSELTESMLLLVKTNESEIARDPERIVASTREFVQAIAPERIDYVIECEQGMCPLRIKETDLATLLLELLTSAVHNVADKGQIVLRCWMTKTGDDNTNEAAIFEISEAVRRTSEQEEGEGRNRGVLLPNSDWHNAVDPYNSSRLGFSVVNGILRSCGGSMEIKDTGPRASTVRICIPRAQSLVPR